MTDFLAGLDVSIFRALNDFCGWNPTFDRIVVHLEVIRGSLFMGIVGGLWYWADEEMPRRRETLLTMIVAVALVVNRVISVLLPFRNRPMYSIGANAPSFEWHADLEHWSSFPSDNATYLFAIAASFWLISRWGGLGLRRLCRVRDARAGLSRYPLSQRHPCRRALIGIATSLVVNREPGRRLIAAPILALEPRYPAYFYGLFFIALTELSGTFPSYPAHRGRHRPFHHRVQQVADQIRYIGGTVRRTSDAPNLVPLMFLPSPLLSATFDCGRGRHGTTGFDGSV
jgi:undecaprenyl-diphosphatase